MTQYDNVTNRIVAMLESGTRPWCQPWTGCAPSRPRRYDGTPYRGMNVLNLWAASMLQGYTSSFWMTFKKAQELGGMVCKGSKADCAFYVGKFIRESDEKTIPFLKAYPVFNADQIAGLAGTYYSDVTAQPATPPNARMLEVDEWISGTGATIVHGGGKAYYRPGTDGIHLPDFAAFPDVAGYYSVALHELTHWTGAPRRLDRTKGAFFGNDDYAAEELVAELGAAYLCADLGVSAEPRADHASYIASWIKQLRADPRAIFKAAGHAERAAGFCHSLQAPIALAA